MGPEAKLYQKLKKNFIGFSLIRLENLSLLGTPDLLVYNNNRHFFTIELKVTKSKKVRFSPHQIAFHLRHPTNTFIIVEVLEYFSNIHVPWFPDQGACYFRLEA
jgi:hypothetical protein